MSRIEMVFFDAGETLIRPYPSFPELFAIVCQENGVVVDPDAVAAVQQQLAPHLVDLAEDTGVTQPSLDPDHSRTFWMFLYRRLLEELDVGGEELAEALFERFSDSASYKIFDDVLPALEELEAAGFRLGLISNFEGWLEQILVEQELGETFDVSVISGLEGVEKPDPRIYRIAVERAEVDPARCVHVGDSPAMDVRPAREIGINAILLDRSGRYMDSAYSTIASLKELHEVITKL